jgi:hypothetical protein
MIAAVACGGADEDTLGKSASRMTEAECRAENRTWLDGNCVLGHVVIEDPDPICLPGDCECDPHQVGCGGGECLPGDCTCNPHQAGCGGGEDPGGGTSSGGSSGTAASCRFSEECARRWRCHRGTCIPPNGNRDGQCGETEECPSGQYCYSGNCRNNPAASTDCIRCQNSFRLDVQECVAAHASASCFADAGFAFNACRDQLAYQCPAPSDVGIVPPPQ